MKYDLNEKYEEFINKTEASALNFDGKQADIFILQKSPSKNTVDEIKNSEAFFQIYTKNNIIFLLVKFGNLDWIDIPYIHKKCTLTKIEDDMAGYPCNIYYADNVTGQVLAKRYLVFSNGLSKAFYYAVKNQEKHLPKNILEKINSIRSSFHPNEIARLSLGKHTNVVGKFLS